MELLMKRSERGIIAAGMMFFVVSALCTASLIISLLGFGTANPEKGRILYAFGRLLFSAYGYSSFLIPVYIFIAGIVLMLSDCSRRKIVYLLFSVIPFFTVSAIEFFTKKIFNVNSASVNFIRISSFVSVSVLLCIIEYILAGLLADFFISRRGEKKSERALFRRSEKTVADSHTDGELFEPSEETDFVPYADTPEENEVHSHEYSVFEEKDTEPLSSQVELTDSDSRLETAPVFADVLPVEECEQAEDEIKEDAHNKEKEVEELSEEQSDDMVLEEFALLNEDEDENDETGLYENPGETGFLNDPFGVEEADPASLPPPPETQKKQSSYSVPAEGLLTSYPGGEYWVIDKDTERAAEALKDTLNEFKIEAEVTGIRKGPVVTMFEILPAPGVKLSKIVALGDNIALRLAASSVRIVAPIPGKHAVGIEVPNKERAIVSFKELIDTDIPAFKKMAIPMVLGKDIAGEAQVLDLAKTPHLLIAGSTGSGKSVCVNSLILSILYKRPPQDVRMILIDPKIVELKLYNDIPHLLTPVITEPKKAFQALQYCLCEMERRYALLDGMGVRDIASYNKRIVERKIATEKLPYIVLIVDEFADLMATTGKELESTVARLAAMSRAVGIHLVLATQRPSIDVITGLIKANIPTRIAFMVASKMDSRIIIDQVGAEKLLGKGDMLYASAVDPFPIRIQGTFVSDTEVENVVDYVKRFGEPDYIDDEIFVDEDEEGFDPGVFSEGEDPLYDKALEIVMQAGKASASYIQRRLKIGYNRAARLVEDMEARGIVGPANGSKPREVIHMV
ncbi:DNA translocase FtsK [Treponema sp. HNW]|uniref:FtsK/SpoIIIE family DNA translocase n=1 Tax=Treponema sp. HNW TaxID=3116654 RepID=UPI003D0AC3BE